jgi:NADPH-dependent glutamate synthase beta subunit-like oxidoreductase
MKPSLKDNLYKPRDQIKIPDTVKLAAYRSFLAAAKQCFGTVQVAEETSRVCAIPGSASCMTDF